VYATGGFVETNNCPSSLAVGASCTATVDITPTQVQNYAGRLVLEFPQGWGDRHQTIEVDGSTDGQTWTQLVAPAAYLFSAGNAAGNNVVAISVPSATVNYIRLDISNNDVQGAPQLAEFQVYSH
jgi:hypothetical protein